MENKIFHLDLNQNDKFLFKPILNFNNFINNKKTLFKKN